MYSGIRKQKLQYFRSLPRSSSFLEGIQPPWIMSFLAPHLFLAFSFQQQVNLISSSSKTADYTVTVKPGIPRKIIPEQICDRAIFEETVILLWSTALMYLFASPGTLPDPAAPLEVYASFLLAHPFPDPPCLARSFWSLVHPIWGRTELNDFSIGSNSVNLAPAVKLINIPDK